MDLGLFMRNRLGLRVWAVTPISLLIVSAVTVGTYCHQLETQRQQRAVALQLVPELEAQIHALREVGATFAVSTQDWSQAESGVRSQVNAAAQRASFAINSLGLEQKATLDGVQSPGIEVLVEGEGDLVAVVSFFNELQQPEVAMLPRTMKLTVTHGTPLPVYKGQFVLQWVTGGKVP